MDNKPGFDRDRTIEFLVSLFPDGDYDNADRELARMAYAHGYLHARIALEKHDSE